MEFEKEGTYFAVYEIKRDLQTEKQKLLDDLWYGTTASWGGSSEEYQAGNEFIINTMARVEEINRILQGIKLGYYKSP